MSKMPWFVSAIFAMLAIVGWWQALTNTKKQSLHKQHRQERVREMVSRKTIPSEDFPEIMQTCLEEKQMQEQIERKAKR